MPRIVAPILDAMLLTDAALGFVARAVPAINVFIVGIPVKIAGSTMTTLVRLTTTPVGHIGASMPAWSPDGRTIAFAADRQTAQQQSIYVVSATGGHPAPLTSNPFGDFAPSWSPDGRKIAFASRRSG